MPSKPSITNLPLKPALPIEYVMVVRAISSNQIVLENFFD